MNFALFVAIYQTAVKAFALAAVIVPDVEDLLASASGPAKRQHAVDEITRRLGCDLPEWMDATLAQMVGICVDYMVRRHNAQGTIAPLATPEVTGQ